MNSKLQHNYRSLKLQQLKILELWFDNDIEPNLIKPYDAYKHFFCVLIFFFQVQPPHVRNMWYLSFCVHLISLYEAFQLHPFDANDSISIFVQLNNIPLEVHVIYIDVSLSINPMIGILVEHTFSQHEKCCYSHGGMGISQTTGSCLPDHLAGHSWFSKNSRYITMMVCRSSLFSTSSPAIAAVCVCDGSRSDRDEVIGHVRFLT